MDVTIELNPTPINQRRKKFPVQFAELNDTSFCNLLNLIWPQPMHLELSWKLNKLTIIEVSCLKSLTLNVLVMPRFFSRLMYFLMKSCDESIFF